MYRRPKFLEVLHEIREEMSREAHYDVELFAEMVREGNWKRDKGQKTTEGFFTLVLEDSADTKDQRPKTKK